MGEVLAPQNVHTVDGNQKSRGSPVEVGSLSHYSQGFMHTIYLLRFYIHVRWLYSRISEPSTVSPYKSTSRNKLNQTVSYEKYISQV